MTVCTNIFHTFLNYFAKWSKKNDIKNLFPLLKPKFAWIGFSMEPVLDLGTLMKYFRMYIGSTPFILDMRVGHKVNREIKKISWNFLLGLLDLKSFLGTKHASPRILAGYQTCHVIYQLNISSIYLRLVDQSQNWIQNFTFWLLGQQQILGGNFKLTCYMNTLVSCKDSRI